MSRATRVLLLAGCACILLLEGPRTFAALAAGWSGPYAATPVADVEPADSEVARR